MSPTYTYPPRPGGFDPQVVFKRDLEQSAWHEAGHVVVARHFKLMAWAHLTRVGEPTIENRAFTGQTIYEKTTKFRNAVIGWAGAIAQDLNREGQGFCLDSVFEYCTLDDDNDLSDTDRAHIFGWPQRWRTCKTAHSILIREYPSLTREAEQLIAGWKEEVL